MNRINLNIFMISVLLIGLSACTPTIANRGNLIDEEKLSSIEPEFSTREDVVILLGSPTQVATFDENTWYYFGRSTQQTSFLDPEVIEQKAITVTFNDAGYVLTVEKQDPEQARAVAPIARRTPTYGRKTTIIEQLVGNLGRPASRNRK